MNHIHSLIWNPATRSYNPAPEFAYSRHKGRNCKLILALAIAAVANGAQAAPSGGDVVSGAATISVNGTSTAIDQSTDAVTINWQGFDIDADETVTFYQPDANSLALNRVLSGNGTEIQGQLNANGRLFILDANGVLFGETAQVNVGSLVASTLDMTSADFANNHFEFSSSGTPAAVTNLGQITVADTGAVALLGGRATNNGIIRARLGNVALAAGNQITLDFAGDGLLNVKIDEGAAQALVQNGGLIQADGGSVLMTAHASDALLQTVVNNTGVIEARTLQEQDGKIMLLGGFNGGTVKVGGTLDASAPDGGDGGFVETSGAIVKVRGDAQIKLASTSGEAGSWLIDPTDMEISYDSTGVNDEVSHVHTQALQNSLAGGDVILTTADAGGEAGNITVLNPIVWASGNRLTLNADNAIIFNDYLHAPNGGLTLNAVGNITTGAEGHINVDSFVLTNGSFTQIAATLPTFIAGDFTLSGGTFTRATGGDGTGTPLQITDIYGLQGLATTPNANVVLVNDIDASGTSGWNSGAGFNPIGTFASQYIGAFDGSGYEIEGLFINRNGQGVGLFGFIGAAGSVSNTGLTGIDVTGSSTVGGIAGRNYGTVQSSYVSGEVTATNNFVGGLVGDNEGAISNTYSTASVSGANLVGGLVGDHEVGSITDSYATGSVNGDDNVGGLIGSTGISATTERTYASGAVTGNSDVGGLVGQVISGASVTDSYWDGFATTMGNVGVGSNTNIFTATEVNGNWGAAPDAYSQATYGNLDLINTWFIADGSSRPMLRAFLDGGNISNLYQLQGMAADLAGTYSLTQDIDAAATAASVAAGNGGNFSDVWGGRGFAPVGKIGAHFTGSLDGQGFAIDGLTIARPTQSFVGLFGVATNSANIQSLGLTNVAIEGFNYVGSFAGLGTSLGGSFTLTDVYAQGIVMATDFYAGGLVGQLGLDESGAQSISQSYAEVDVTSTGTYVGGLVGSSSGEISLSYATGSAEGARGVGGLVGQQTGGSIFDSYATGAANASIESASGLVGRRDSGLISRSWASGAVTGGALLGGLIGNDLAGGGVTDSYWDSFTTGQADATAGGAVVGANAVSGDWNDVGVNAYNEGSYTGFDFDNVWFIAEGSSRPMLRTFLNGGNISNIYQLQGMAANVAGNYTLTQNIDASATAASLTAGNGGNYSDVWGGRGFAPVGTGGFEFTGELDGNGFVIDGLTIYRLDQTWVGLFGHTDGATLNDIALTEVDIVGNDAVGALVGEQEGGTTTNSYSTGQVEGTLNAVGGLLGINNGGSIAASYSNASIDGEDYIGGLVGLNTGIVANSYATGDVSGNGAVGGLVGVNNAPGSISQSYAVGSVTGVNISTGGLVGHNNSTIVDSFWSTDIELVGVGSGDGTGATGLNTAGFMAPGSFDAWGTDIDDVGGTGAVWRIYEGRSAPLLRNFLPEIDVIAYDDSQVYDGDPYQGLHQINGTSGNGVRYGNNYAEFLAVFGEDGTPYGVADDVGSSDLEYIGNSQGAIDAGIYDITLSELWSHQQGFDIVLKDGTLTITPAGISLTVTVNDASKVYGNADPAFSWAVTDGDLADGDTLTGTLSRQPGENVGNYTIFGNVNGDLASGNYIVNVNNGVFTITPRPITISVADASKIYGNVDPDFSWALTSGNLVFGHQLTGELVRAPGENVGDYAIGANFSGALASGNYAVTLDQGTLTITPRDIVINIANADKIYGEADPEFTWAVTSGGLVEGDELSGTLTRAPGENVGGYTISGMVDGDLANGNYSYTLNNGLLTISPRPVVLTADNLMKIYGEEDPELTWSITSGSLVGDDTLMVSVSREDGSNVGTYAIMLDAGGDATNSNYDLSLVDGQLQITPANLTVTANDVTGYWDLLPPFTASVEGLVNGDTESGVFGNSLSVISNLVIPVPGNYVLTPVATLIGENYQVSFVDGLLTLLSSNPGGNYIEALTSTQLPAREALGRERRANIYEGRPLLDGSEDGIVLHVLDGGIRLDPETLAAFGIVFPDAVNFPVNSAVVDERYFAKLREFVQQLKQFPDVHVLVEGHTSSTGSLALNQRLSERRAEAVAKVLEDMGLATDRMRTEHFNYQRPVATNDTPEGRYLNQRTEMVEDEQKR